MPFDLIATYSIGSQNNSAHGKGLGQHFPMIWEEGSVTKVPLQYRSFQKFEMRGHPPSQVLGWCMASLLTSFSICVHCYFASRVGVCGMLLAEGRLGVGGGSGNRTHTGGECRR